MLRSLLKREVKLGVRLSTPFFHTGAFVLFCGLLFPLSGADTETLRRYGPGVIWIFCLFSLTLNLPTYFQQDEKEGILEHLSFYDSVGYGVFFTKALTQTVFLGGSLLLTSLVLGILFRVSPSVILWGGLALAVALPGLVFLTGLGAAFFVAAAVPPLIRPLLLFPLYIPLFVFGIHVIEAVMVHQSPMPTLKILGGLSLFSLCLSTFIGGKVLEP